ncbi:GAF domain-containing protein [Flavobacterium gawalongense]|uniref:GAF domain-containing protein n=1 Tax=Flavobacterium gawalongense TaxID=2594432 RepID=A0A553BV33_9FLAO|nr:GAF domain-containing protein [Flavobacterium gawalongense]TRX02793.1 GAF domain-containing protein [Flavobacterium gawalongense]TRX08101.1 GAF domain-containing protein [Flavobacterium gawalongense]TRX11379.1 GAF domain-containing protein [Flavobacterium gawalongense]TRX12109.1 GAF domain-containing protein [Flavobacterium gawalongense]TRX29014.1 GAF domain-containing protein [Flavobacterium gawalongense]
MNHNFFKDSPFKTLISFHKLIETLEEIAATNVDYRSNYAKALLKEIEPFPEFRTGIEDLNLIHDNETLIQYLLADLFPTALTHNEIKAVTIPFQNFTFNYTERFKKILHNAGTTFDMAIRDFDDHQFYIMNCILILNTFYNQHFDFNKPLFYDIPDANGIMKHYRILYNADFMEIIPTDKAITLTPEDIDLLMDNYDTIDLWKEKFPSESWILKGFGLVSLFDASIESAVSNLKSNLLKSETEQAANTPNFETIFRSIFKISDLKVGFIIYNEEDEKFIMPPYDDKKIGSFILHDIEEADCKDTLFGCSLATILEHNKPFIVSNVEKLALTSGNEKLGEHLLKQNIQSCILAPVIKNDKLLGIIELVSAKPRELNSINANNLDLILPYLVDTLERYNNDMQHQIEAIIQREYTTIHPSVYWKFRKEAQKYFQTSNQSKDYIFKEIVFTEVYPLYGQIDIKGSSEHRNETVKEDLKNQLKTLLQIFENLKSNTNLVLLEQRKFELQSFFNELGSPLKADTEQQMQRYIETEIHPILKNSRMDNECHVLVEDYFEKLDEKTGLFYQSRKKFDNAMSIVNKKLAGILDKKQTEAQNIFPHYYERFKTDGVEHNLYIGASIAPNQTFDMMYLNNLRLWQLQTLCEMELEHHQLKSSLPYKLDVTSLILVFSSPISIRFRMDEKRFDVDGTYNARYEVVKKRIDKANIKGTKDRITEKEKITIVYSHNQEETEYLKYVKFLQFKNILEPTIEQFEVEELQGVSGLRAIRVKVVNTGNGAMTKKYSYQDLLDELN